MTNSEGNLGEMEEERKALRKEKRRRKKKEKRRRAKEVDNSEANEEEQSALRNDTEQKVGGDIEVEIGEILPNKVEHKKKKKRKRHDSNTVDDAGDMYVSKKKRKKEKKKSKHQDKDTVDNMEMSKKKEKKKKRNPEDKDTVDNMEMSKKKEKKKKRNPEDKDTVDNMEMSKKRRKKVRDGPSDGTGSEHVNEVNVSQKKKKRNNEKRDGQIMGKGVERQNKENGESKVVDGVLGQRPRVFCGSTSMCVGEEELKDWENNGNVVSKGRFTKKEDEIMEQTVSGFLHGTHGITLEEYVELLRKARMEKKRAPALGVFRELKKALPHRTKSSIHERFNRVFVREKGGPWTPEEENRLRDFVAENGRQFAELASDLGRLPRDLKDKWVELEKKESVVDKKWNEKKKEKLLSVVNALDTELTDSVWNDVQREHFPSIPVWFLRERLRNKRSSGLHPDWGDEDRKELIIRLWRSGVSNEGDVTWSKLFIPHGGRSVKREYFQMKNAYAPDSATFEEALKRIGKNLHIHISKI